MLTQAFRCQVAGFEHSSSPLHHMHAFLLVKTKESHVILTNIFPHLQAISSRNYSNQLEMSGTDLHERNCLDLRYLANPTKELQAPQYTSILQAQLINQNLN
jgi:hypothetical protein